MRILLPRARRLPTLLLASSLALLLALPAARADESAAVDLLNQAKDLEKVQRDSEGALALYEELARRDDLPTALKGEALWGAARCHKQAGREDMAERYWDRILSDEALASDLRTWANREKQEKARRDAGSGEAPDAAAARVRERIREEERARAQERVADARVALAARRFQAATHLCLLALKLDPENAEAQALLDEIEARRPDLGNVLGRLIQFVQTKELEEFEWLRGEVRNIERAARVAFDGGDWREADRLYRKALGLLDDSGFLTLGATVDTGSLTEVRARLLTFLRETHDRGEAAGLSFESEPAAPDLTARRGSGARALFGTLADMFSPREAGGEALHFFRFAPSVARGAGKRLVTSNFVSPLRAEHTQGSLGRARWAERWIRSHIGVAWMSTDELARRGVDSTDRARRRLLIRVGDLVCAQTGEQEHGRIEALHRAFAEAPPALRLDLRLYAVDAAGAVRSAEALRTRAGPRDAGLDHVVAGRLLAECVDAVEGLQGVTPLGSAQVRLDGETSLQLELTRFTAEHPAYRNVGAPDLTIEDADARYGLWLDLYAEDLPGRVAAGDGRSALSVRARVNLPHPLHASHVVPRASRSNPTWTRRPILLERVVESDREVPHYGTFVLQGLPNPFPDSNQERGELLVLLGITRQDTPTPDPPRVTREPAILPADVVSREYRLGPLSTEVDDHVMPGAGWPALRTVAEGMSPPDRRRQRDRNLANILMQLAGIDAQGPGGADAVLVQDHLVIGRLGNADHIRLQQAVQRLRAHESDLYEVSVRTAEVPRALWEQWSAGEGMERNRRGHWRVRGTAREALERELEALVDRRGLFDTVRTQPARATQQVAHVALRSRHLTKDLHRRLLDDDRARFTPIPGVAEEGLVVEVRPNLDFEQEGASLRSVRVRARAARLKAVEPRPYPGTDQPGARYDVPLWFPGTERTHSEAEDAEILDDETLLALPLPSPGADDRRILVVVGVRRVQ